MSKCSSCGKIIIFGGIKIHEGIFCSEPCIKNFGKPKFHEDKTHRPQNLNYSEYLNDKNIIKNKITEITASNGYLLLTKDTLVLCRSGAASYSFGGGVKIKKIPLDSISAIDVRKATLTTDLEVTIPGSQEITNSVENFTNRMLNENLFMFPIQMFNNVSNFADLVMECRLKLIDSRSNHVVSRDKEINSIPSQIKQLSELRDLGILTEEEFQIKKNDLLSRM